ncbi:condensin complex subunit 3 [Planococcus citri]|uniref:condensin complex subunit 3 n=1 Tax=Planococcus citri TaxID=170843 RepID=UPI0031F7F6C8
MDFEIRKDAEISTIFNESQSDHIQESLIVKLIRIYNEADDEEFTSSFITCLKTVMCAPGDVNIAVDKVFEFVAQFIITVAGLDAPDNSHVPEETLVLCYNVFGFMKKNHDVPSPIVRKRVCQFISKLLLRMSPDAMLDIKICDMIVQIMLERIKDKVPVIRMQAILAVYRLQDSSDKTCPVTKALADCMEHDTSAEVRRLALSKISIVHRYLIEKIIQRTDDVSEKVRKEAYTVLSRLHIKQFTIEQRKQLLDTGLYDNNELVRNTVKSVLLPAWLKRLDYKYLDFLKALDLQVRSMEMTTKALMSLFHSSADENALQTLKPIMDSMNLVTFDKLNPESAFFWRCYVFFQSSMVSEKNNYRWESSKSYDATQDGLLPDLSIFCTYIKTYYEVTSTEFSDDQPWRKKEQEFILIQLVELCKTYDYGDEVGRKELKVLCVELLKNIEMETIRPVTELYFMLQTNLNESISKITELINDLLYPNAADNDDQSRPVNSTEQIDMSPNEEQDMKFKIAQLNVKISELKEQQEDAIRNEDFTKAQDLKAEISDMLDKIQDLKATLMGTRSINSVNFTEDSISDHEEEEDPKNPWENLELATVRRSLTILQEMLHLSIVKQLTPELRTLFQMLVLPGCKSDNCVIAPLATEVLGSCCLRDVALAKEHFVTFFALCGKSDICASALKVIFDFLLCYGPNAFDINNLNDYEKYAKISSTRKVRKNRVPDTDDEDSSDFSSEENGDDMQPPENAQDTGVSGYTFISVLVDLLNDEFVDARFTVVHGLCQLMAAGKLKSSKVLARLILIWFHPASKESVEIRDCLNFFFPFYVKHCSWSLSLFENAIVTTMDTLFNAPVNNPLSIIDQKSVLKVLCNLTSPSFVHENPEVGENTHFNIAVSLCNHIIDLNDSTHQAVLLKGLDYLDLTCTDPVMLPTLETLMDKVIKKFSKKSNKKLTGEAKKLLTKILSVKKNRQKVSSIQNTILERSEENLDEIIEES